MDPKRMGDERTIKWSCWGGIQPELLLVPAPLGAVIERGSRRAKGSILCGNAPSPHRPIATAVNS